MLITLAEDAKLTTTEKVDRMIRAEVPDPNEDPVLYERVKEHMVHGTTISACAVRQFYTYFNRFFDFLTTSRISF